MERFLAARALLAVIDLRGDDEAGLSAIATLADLSRQGEFAILALADSGRSSGIAARCFEAGATHFLDLDHAGADLSQALNFAYRFVEHLRGGEGAADQFRQLLTRRDLEWSFDKSDISHATNSPALQSYWPDVDFTKYPATGLLRTMTDEEWQKVRGALGRLRTGSPQAAVPQKIGEMKVIHHLHDDGTRLSGRVELAGTEDDGNNWLERDLLSGLRNSASARKWIDRRLSEGRKLGALVLSVRNFPSINASLGRNRGDRVLRDFASRLIAQCERLDDQNTVIARFEGQNFLVAHQLEDAEKFEDFAAELLRSMAKPLELDGEPLQLDIRGGLATGGATTGGALLLRKASLALAEAMTSESNVLHVNDDEDEIIILEQRLGSEFLGALNRGEIVVTLQPQFNLETGQLTGAEALTRWDHPTFGLLGAATLFSVAERLGELRRLSDHIHQRALSIGKEWPESLSFLRLSINVTAGDLANRHFAEHVMSMLSHSGFPANRLTLEITESELIADLSRSSGQLARLREQGLKVAIDDFGTGYSSLSYLKQLPLDYLKIDSGLTGTISGSEKDRVVVRSIIKMAKELDLQVIAEGVETEGQRQSLQEEGCDFFQGFLRSGPLLPDEFEAFALRSN